MTGRSNNISKHLWDGESDWSQATFGVDADRGPIGPLKHLQKEVEEAINEPGDLTEYADCLLLIFDATRRAGFDHDALFNAALNKLEQNRLRKWPTTSSDEPVMHVKG